MTDTPETTQPETTTPAPTQPAGESPVATEITSDVEKIATDVDKAAQTVEQKAPEVIQKADTLATTVEDHLGELKNIVEQYDLHSLLSNPITTLENALGIHKAAK